jgi:tetratricopeptide (TPR) repeat protein
MSQRIFSLVHGRFLASSACLAAVASLLSAGCASTPREVAPKASSNPPLASQTARPVESKKSSAPSNLARTFEEAVSRGDTAWRAGEADMAIYQYVQALSFRPRDVDTLCKLGIVEQVKGNLELAARAFELAANADPDNVRVSARLGLILLALGKNDGARFWLQRSADAQSADWRVYDGLGVAEQQEGDNAAALKHLRQAVEMAPTQPAPLLHCGQAMFNSGDYAGAEDTVRAALSRGNVPEGRRVLGQIQAKRRQYSESIDTLLQALDPPAAYGAVAKLALENGDNAVALELFEKAAAASPVYSPETQRSAAIARERLAASNK